LFDRCPVSSTTGFRVTGYNARNDEVRDNVTRMRREWEAQRWALAAVRRFNATLSAKGHVWLWPKIAAALTKHYWLHIACDSCGTVVDLNLRVKRRDPEASTRIALRDAQCPRCNGYGRPRIIA
jgi:ribosomal protein L44E